MECSLNVISRLPSPLATPLPPEISSVGEASNLSFEMTEADM